MGLAILRIVEKGFTYENEQEPTPKDDINSHRNAQAASAIISALSASEYTKVMGIKNAHAIWKKLEVSHEGTDVVKEAREDLLRGQYNLFIMKKDEGPQQVHDRLMDIVNKRRALGTKLDDMEVNKRLLQALQPQNSHICSLIRQKEGFKNFSTDEVLGRLLAQKEQDDEATRINELLGKSSSEKKNVVFKAKKKKIIVEDSSKSESDDEMALLVKRFTKFIKKGGFTKKSFEKNKTRRSKRTCYECGEVGHFIAECPKNKDKEEKKHDKYHKREKKYKNKKIYKGQAHIGQEWDSNDSDSDSDSEDEGIATLAIGEASTNKRLFNDSSDDEDDQPPICLMAKGSKVSSKEKVKSFMHDNDSDNEDASLPKLLEFMSFLEKQKKDLERQEEILER